VPARPGGEPAQAERQGESWQEQALQKSSEALPVLPLIGSHDGEGFDSGAETDRLFALTERAVS